MEKTKRKYVVFAIVVSMACILLRGVLLFCSNDVYATSINIKGKDVSLFHKNISCKVLMQNNYKEHRSNMIVDEKEYHAIICKLSLAEQMKETLCWHCTWKPIIVYCFLEVVLIGLLLLFIKEKKRCE